MVRIEKQIDSIYTFCFLIKGHRAKDYVRISLAAIRSSSREALERVKEKLECPGMIYDGYNGPERREPKISAAQIPNLIFPRYTIGLDLRNYDTYFPELNEELRESGLYVLEPAGVQGENINILVR